MTQSRSSQVDLSSTRYYHIYSRCVREAYLLESSRGIDHKQLFIERLKLLSSSFAVDVCAYAVMSNHYHLVLHIDVERVSRWDDKEVASRYMRFSRHGLLSRWLSGATLDKSEQSQVDALLPVIRERLGDLSWYMRCLNEWVARQINAEEGVSGRFWASRFKSQALLDEAALLTCMQYVDLNPIRAQMGVSTLEASDYTSIQEHLIAYQRRHQKPLLNPLKKRAKHTALNKHQQPQGLLPFQQPGKPSKGPGIPFYLEDYFRLIEWTGKAIREDKAGHIPETITPILEKLHINPSQWLSTVQQLEKDFTQAIGAVTHIQAYCQRLTAASKKKKGPSRVFSWFRGMNKARQVFAA